MKTITRKFLVKQIPDLTGRKHWIQHRFYLYRKNGVVIRVQSKNDEYELERKASESDLVRKSEKITITKEEFDAISTLVTDTIVRDSYLISETPHVVLRMYHGRFEGLVRVEIEFPSVAEANQFTPLVWMGKEITTTPLAKDETLLELTDENFQMLLLTSKGK